MTFQQGPLDCICHVCGKQATGVGIGFNTPRDTDPRWLCVECSLLIEDIKKVKRMNFYELKARAGGMDAGAEFVEKHGTDLAEWPEAVVLEFVGAVWRGCADRIRQLVRDDAAPF